MRALKNYFTLSRVHACLPRTTLGSGPAGRQGFFFNSNMFLICVIVC
jgi:hypothetical protein